MDHDQSQGQGAHNGASQGGFHGDNGASQGGGNQGGAGGFQSTPPAMNPMQAGSQPMQYNPVQQYVPTPPAPQPQPINPMPTPQYGGMSDGGMPQAGGAQMGGGYAPAGTQPATQAPVTQGGQAPQGGSFADFQQQQAGKEFKPSTPVTSTLGLSEEEILGGDKNIFGRPIPVDANKPQDAKGQFEAILSAQVVPNPELKFESQEFLELLAGSISLLYEEKQEILRMLPQMKQEQMDQLLTILKDEKNKFNELVEQHKEEMVQAKQKQMEEAKVQLQNSAAEEQARRAQEQQAAEDLLRGL